MQYVILNMMRITQVLFSPIASDTQPSGDLDDPLAPSPPRQNRQRHGSQSRRQNKRKPFIAKSLKPVVHRCAACTRSYPMIHGSMKPCRCVQSRPRHVCMHAVSTLPGLRHTRRLPAITSIGVWPTFLQHYARSCLVAHASESIHKYT